MDSKAIKLTGTHIGTEPMPHAVGLLGQRNAMRLAHGLGRIKQTEINLRRMFREHGEIDTLAIPCGSQWRGPSWPDSHCNQLRAETVSKIINGSARPDLVESVSSNKRKVAIWFEDHRVIDSLVTARHACCYCVRAIFLIQVRSSERRHRLWERCRDHIPFFPMSHRTLAAVCVIRTGARAHG